MHRQRHTMLCHVTCAFPVCAHAWRGCKLLCTCMALSGASRSWTTWSTPVQRLFCSSASVSLPLTSWCYSVQPTRSPGACKRPSPSTRDHNKACCLVQLELLLRRLPCISGPGGSCSTKWILCSFLYRSLRNQECMVCSR